jgi:hypothetical protein
MGIIGFDERDLSCDGLMGFLRVFGSLEGLDVFQYFALNRSGDTCEFTMDF